MKCLIVLIFAGPLLAQPIAPRCWIGGGAGWSRFQTPQTSLWQSLGVHVGRGYYSYWALDTTRRSSSLRTGVAKMLVVNQDRFGLLALVDAGVDSAGAAAGAIYGGGVIVTYALPGPVPGLHLAVAVRIYKGNTTVPNDVRPVYSVGFAKTFP